VLSEIFKTRVIDAWKNAPHRGPSQAKEGGWVTVMKGDTVRRK
jgi:hypothetical protein